MSENTIQVGLITISDRAAAGEYEDDGGPAVRKSCAEDYGWEVISEAVIPDDLEMIQTTIRAFSA